MDFLPAAWLVRVDDIRASMTMGQPFPGVWLPRNMNIHAGLTLALGSYEATYGRAFTEYREAEVKTTIKVPKLSQGGAPQWSPLQNASSTEHGPFVPDADQQPPAETIREIRVHGNAAVTDEDVLKLAGIAVGDPITADSVKLVEKRLKDSDKFETVEVRKRYRSIDDPTDVALVLIVHERAGVASSAAGGGAPGKITRPWHRAFTDRLMFFPILNYEDGYGFTYGARFSTIDLLGLGERLSTPLTWGGTKRAAIEFERTFKAGPVTRVFSSFGIWNRENPRFEIDDQRVELKGRVERQFAHMVRVGVDGARSSVSFGTLDDQIWTVGTNVVLDTRGDPAFPGNAVLLGGGWSQLNVRGHDAINRYNTDARGYLRVVRQAVLAGRIQYFTSDGPLPPYERLLLGGSSSLRGFPTGAFDGDRMVVTSAELRVPITSVLSGAKLGVDAFTDVSKAVNFDESLSDARWRQGVGAGVFLIAPLVKINLDVGHGLDGGGTRVILSTGFNY
jgi:outer membrane protein assembly factor BamA